MSTILSQLWTGTGPAPTTFNEYAARTVLPDPGVLAEYRTAKTRWPEILLAGEEIFRRLMPSVPFAMHHAINLLTTTMNPAHVDGVLAHIAENAASDDRHKFLANTHHVFVDPHGAPFLKLVQEYPALQRNLEILVLAPMLARAIAELARVEPLEEARMLAKARADAVADGMSANEARSPQKSHIVEAWREYINALSKALSDVQGKRRMGEQRVVEGQQGRWLFSAMQTLEPIIVHLDFAPQPAAAAA